MTQLWFSVRSLRRTRSKIIIKVTSNNQRLGQPLEVRKGHLTDGQIPFILKVMLLETNRSDDF